MILMILLHLLEFWLGDIIVYHLNLLYIPCRRRLGWDKPIPSFKKMAISCITPERKDI